MSHTKKIAERTKQGISIPVDHALTFKVHNTKQMVDLCKRGIITRADAGNQTPDGYVDGYWIAFTLYSSN